MTAAGSKAAATRFLRRGNNTSNSPAAFADRRVDKLILSAMLRITHLSFPPASDWHSDARIRREYFVCFCFKAKNAKKPQTVLYNCFAAKCAYSVSVSLLGRKLKNPHGRRGKITLAIPAGFLCPLAVFWLLTGLRERTNPREKTQNLKNSVPKNVFSIA